MKIALINPPPRTEFEKHWGEFPGLGLAYVAAGLRDAGHDIVLLDGKLVAEMTVDTIVERVLTISPDLVGITCMTVEFPNAALIAEKIKRRSSVPIVVGGAHVNAVETEVLDEAPAFDYACIGEGEITACELAATLAAGGDVSKVLGIGYRQNGVAMRTAARPYPKDYDQLPFPAWEMFNMGEQIPILTHRGCPFQCTFCGHNSGFSPRYRTPENVLDELEHVVDKYKPKNIRFEDETFGLNLPRTKAILRGIIDRGLNKKTTFSAQTRVDRVDRDFIRLLKDCNFEMLELGVESGNPEVLERIQKGITLDQVERAVGFAKAEGIRVWCKFILGHPHETRQTVMDTLAFIAKINPDRLSVSVMTPFPGTPIFEMAIRGEGGYRLLSRDWTKFDKYAKGVLELDGISLGELKLYQILAYVRLYLQNGRFGDLFGLVRRHPQMAVEMAVDAAKRITMGRQEKPVPVQAPKTSLEETMRARGWKKPGTPKRLRVLT